MIKVGFNLLSRNQILESKYHDVPGCLTFRSGQLWMWTNTKS